MNNIGPGTLQIGKDELERKIDELKRQELIASHRGDFTSADIYYEKWMLLRSTPQNENGTFTITV